MDLPMRPRKQGSRPGAPSCSGMRAWCCKDRGPEPLGAGDSIAPSAVYPCSSWAAYHRSSPLLTKGWGLCQADLQEDWVVIPLPQLPPGWAALQSRTLGASVCCSWVLLRFPPVFSGLRVSLVPGAQHPILLSPRNVTSQSHLDLKLWSCHTLRNELLGVASVSLSSMPKQSKGQGISLLH